MKTSAACTSLLRWIAHEGGRSANHIWQTKRRGGRRLPRLREQDLWSSWIWLCALTLGSLIITAATCSAGPNLHQEIWDRVINIDREIAGWRRAGSFELGATIVIGIIGLVITLIQAIPSISIKIITAILGFMSGAIVVVNQNYFDADHRAYRSLATQAGRLLDNFKMEFAPYSDPLSKEDFKFLCDDLKKLENDLADLQRAIFGKNPVPAARSSTSAFSFSLVTSAYAAEGTMEIPAWAKTVPSDAENIYFVGIANDRTPTGARDAAEKQAKASAESSFATAVGSYSQILPEDAGHLAHDIAGSGEIVSTFVVPAAEAYRGYALFRVPRTQALLSTKAFVVAHGLSVDPKLLNQVAAGNKAIATAATQANEQKKAAQNGVAYVQVALPADRPIGAVLCQAIGEVVSAPGVEVKISQPANTVRYFNPADSDLAAKVKDVAEKALAAEGYHVQLNVKDEYAEGYKAPKHVHQLEIWLAPIPRVPPRVTLQAQAGTPPERIEQLKKKLMAAGYEVVISNTAHEVASQEAGVFYYKKSDAEEANSLIKALPDFGLLTSQDTASLAKAPADSPPRQYELRVGKDSFAAQKSQTP